MGTDAGGRWTESPILPELPPPPADRVLVRGARLVHVLNVQASDPGKRPVGHTEAVILAWARLGDGGWGVLIAWDSSWQHNSRTTGKGRWAWCRLLADRVRPVNPPRKVIDGGEWHGHHGASEFAKAVRQAATSLPERQRRAALTPPGSGGPDQPRHGRDPDRGGIASQSSGRGLGDAIATPRLWPPGRPGARTSTRSLSWSSTRGPR